ncbi:flavodoxin domain-containing protein [Collinsella provencensis]|uniref:flavodoxin domain-containing protein n=1 Tax=Collinsella provencensis TaxID=1937461 RepID=UPI000C83C59F|nr:flavodoxin domain-containing protein [Collinsella provencensis]
MDEVTNELKTVILYRSKHHGNTKKLVDAVAAAHPEITVIDVASLGKREYPDLSPYHIIAFASGIYYGKFDADIRRIAEECLRDGDNVIGFITYGGNDKHNGRELSGICRLKFANLLSVYGCPGFDTYGPFKFVGGMNKGRPNEEDIAGAVEFYDRIVKDYGQIFLDERAKRDKRDAYNREHPTGGLIAGIKRSARKLAGKRKDSGKE